MREDTTAIEPIGRHVLVDFHGIPSAELINESKLVELLLRALEQAGFNVIDHCSHRFPGQQSGITAMALLSESHATIHTYPEYGYAALDVFSCGRPDPERVIRFMAGVLQPTRIETHEQSRGLSAKNSGNQLLISGQSRSVR